MPPKPLGLRPGAALAAARVRNSDPVIAAVEAPTSSKKLRRVSMTAIIARELPANTANEPTSFPGLDSSMTS
jgi:hypothetical protein